MLQVVIQIKKQWQVCGFAHRAAGMPFVFASRRQKDQKAHNLNT